jgi:hypothetical protein
MILAGSWASWAFRLSLGWAAGFSSTELKGSELAKRRPMTPLLLMRQG